MSTSPEQMKLFPRKPGFHYAKLSHSPRLQRVRDFLIDGQWHSSRDIIQGANICAISAAISELRSNGCNIECEQRGRIWYYRMGASA